MQSLLVETLEDEKYSPEVNEKGIVLAVRGENNDGRHLVLNTHLDTVPPHVPYERDGDVVRGRVRATRKARSQRSSTRSVRCR